MALTFLKKDIRRISMGRTMFRTYRVEMDAEQWPWAALLIILMMICNEIVFHG